MILRRDSRQDLHRYRLSTSVCFRKAHQTLIRVFPHQAGETDLPNGEKSLTNYEAPSEVSYGNVVWIPPVLHERFISSRLGY